MARAKSRQGDYTEACSLMQRAITLAESIRGRIATQELRLSYVATARQYFEFYIDSLMQLDRLGTRPAYAARALEICERSRARSLLEMLSDSDIEIREGVDPVLLEKERSINQQLDYYAERKLRLAGRNGKQQEFEQVRRRIEELEIESRTVKAAIRRTSPHYAILTQPQPLTAGAIQHEIADENTTVLEYALGEAHSFLWVIDTAAIHSFEIPKRADVEQVARDLYFTANQRDKRAHFVRTAGQRWASKLRSAETGWRRN